MGIGRWVTAGVVTAVALFVACGGDGAPRVQPGQDQLRAMLLTAEDLPAGFTAGKVHSVIPVDTPRSPDEIGNLRVQLESAQPPPGPGDIGCVTSYVALLSSAERASDAVERAASDFGLAPDVPGTTERLDPPDIGDETAAVFVESPVYGLGSCGTRRVTGLTEVVFSQGPTFSQVSVFTAEGKPPSDRVWEIARKQLDRVERALGTVTPE